ncbi:MAG TPA: tetratricopeptide repeat protein [Gemmatimonadales bacterium]|nr:tetratricopeptide repeat protein [Gemmatimonadales bacterium]
MADEIRALSAQLAQDPQSLVFLRLGEALRRKGQLDAAMRVATNGLERHPHLADAHDLYARVLTDKHDYEHAFDEWDMAVQIAPNHTGALKGLAFLYFKVGDIAQAEAHLEAARKIEPDDPSVDQAIAMVRGGVTPPAPEPSAAPAPLPPLPPPPRPPPPAPRHLRRPHLPPPHRVSTSPASLPGSMVPTKASCSSTVQDASSAGRCETSPGLM